jgi:hypothetical protein
MKIAASVVAVALAIGLALFQPWRLLTRSSIDEAVPVAGASANQTPTHVMTHDPTGPAKPSIGPRTLAAGTFIDGEHATSGRARILQLPDGTRYLRLEGFSTSDGPDVQVWLTDQKAGGADWGKYDDGRYVALGVLKATDGNQNYSIPAGATLSGLTSVVIWCDRFNVAFGTAPLGFRT